MTDFIVIPTWPEFNNLNHVYLPEGVCPTLTTQCAHSKPPLGLVADRRSHSTESPDSHE